VTLSLGVDLSLRSSGWALWGGACGRIRTDLRAQRGMTPIVRRRHIAERVVAVAEDAAEPVLVVVERSWIGPSASALVLLHGVVADAVERSGAALVYVAPSLLKRHALGRGSAIKAEMVGAAQRAGYAGAQNDEADAWMLALVGHHLLNGTDHLTPQRAACLAGVEWEILLPPDA